MKSLERALQTGGGLMGATSRRVTAKLDGGPIISQEAVTTEAENDFQGLSETMFKCERLSTLLALKRHDSRSFALAIAILSLIDQIEVNITMSPTMENLAK